MVGLFCSNAATLPEFGGRDLSGGAGVIPTPLTFCDRTFLPFEFVKTMGLPLNFAPLPEWLFVACAECCLGVSFRLGLGVTLECPLDRDG